MAAEFIFSQSYVLNSSVFFLSSDVDFNVSGVFAMPGCPGTPDIEYGTIDRRRPGSQGSLESETARKDRYKSHPRVHKHDSNSTVVSASYVVASESVTVKADSLSPQLGAV